MPSTGMDATRWALVSADVEVMVDGAHVEEAESPQDSTTPLAPFNQSLDWTLQRFRERFGRTWVAGRLVLRSDSLEFRPREMEDGLHSSTPIMVRLADVSAVSAESRVFSKLVRVAISSGQQLTFRCRNPHALAEQLRMAAGAVRAAA
jgi:hypothetical protein